MDKTVIVDDEAFKRVLSKLGPKYEYKKFIGKGAFSRVYLLHHRHLGQYHALKIMNNQYILQTLKKGDAWDIHKEFAGIQKRFLNEARSYNKIDHPNVVRVFDVDVLEDTNGGPGISYIIMQYVEGQSLKSLIEENSPLEIDRVMAISKDILRAIARIHEAGIVHRDLKPANIVIEKESNRAILIDFGLARDINIAESTAMAEVEKSLGTPIYMSPDQFHVPGSIGPGIDLYAFGILLYEMLTGDVPFKGTPDEIKKGHLLSPVPDIKEKNPLAPAGFQKIIKKALAKEPEKRYQSAEDLLADLEKIPPEMAAGKTGKAKKKAGKQAGDVLNNGEPGEKKPGYRLYLFITLAVLAMAVVIYIFILSPGKNHEPGYKEYIEEAKINFEKGNLEKAAYNVYAARKLRDTPEAGELAGRIEALTLHAEAEEYLKKGELKNALDSLNRLKALGETPKTAELEESIYTGSESAADAYCKEGKLPEAKENLAVAKAIKPGSDLRDLETRIAFLETMPVEVRTVYKTAQKIGQNDKKYWEAEFRDGIVMVYIPAGKGLPGFWLGKTEVSTAQYLKFANESRSNEPEWRERGSRFNLETGDDDYYRNQTGADFPIVGISWNNAAAYCRWLSTKTGLTFRLPSEAQWQKGAQGTDGRPYPWGAGNPGDNLANINSPAGKTVKVDANPLGASPYGLLNMAGNVEEWCENQAARGGSFYSNERETRCTTPGKRYESSERNHALGFRLCMAIGKVVEW